MAKISNEEMRKLALDIMFNPPDLSTAAEEIDPNFEGGFSWGAEVTHALNSPGFKTVDDFEYLPNVDNESYTPPSKEAILEKWSTLFYEYCNKYYQLERKVDYGAVEEQLDLLYHDIENGVFGESAKTGEFFKYITSVKTRYLKE